MNDEMILKMAADQYGCDVSDLLSYSIKEDCIVIIAPSGQKFTYNFDDLMTIHARMVQPAGVKTTPKKAAPAPVASDSKPEAQPARKSRASSSSRKPTTRSRTAKK